MRNNLNDALAFAAQGYAVFPIHSPTATRKCDCGDKTCGTMDEKGEIIGSPSKHPRTIHGLADATTDEDTVTRWWAMWPHANVAVATGPESGLVVLDIDPRHGGEDEMRRLIGEHGKLPYGPSYETGSGGAHYWFQHPGFKITSRNAASGLDVKGDGGYVIVPPSVHSTGGSYAWYEDCGLSVVRPEIPPWLIDLMQSKDEKRTGAQPIPEDVTAGRNNTLASLAGTLRSRGQNESAIFKMLMALNETWSNPLGATEVGKIAASICRYEAGSPNGPIIIDTGPATLGRRKVEKNTYAPRPYTAVELLGREIPDIRQVVQDLLPEGLAVLAGKPKLGKSFMSFNIALAIAQGGVVMGSLGAGEGEALVLALEDNERRLKKRLTGLLDGAVAPERLYMETQWPREDEGGVEVLDAWLGLHPLCQLVVIDTLAKFRPKGVDAKYSGDYAAMEGLQELAGKHGISILLITHYRKQFSDDWLDNVTGTLGIAGAADTILGLERPRGVAGQAGAILHATGRDIEEKDYALKMDGLTGNWTILGDANEYQMGLETARLVAVLRENGAPMKVNEIATRLGKKRAATSVLCTRAAMGDAIKSHGGGLYGPL